MSNYTPEDARGDIPDARAFLEALRDERFDDAEFIIRCWEEQGKCKEFHYALANLFFMSHGPQVNDRLNDLRRFIHDQNGR